MLVMVLKNRLLKKLIQINRISLNPHTLLIGKVWGS